MEKRIYILIMFAAIPFTIFSQVAAKPMVLKAKNFKHYVDYFNKMEDENIAAGHTQC